MTEKNLDKFPYTVAELQEKSRQLKQLATEVENLKKEVRSLMGDATVARFGEQVVFTNEPVDKLRTSDLRQEAPELYQQYLREKTVTAFDVEAFRQDHPRLFALYQSRQFNIK